MYYYGLANRAKPDKMTRRHGPIHIVADFNKYIPLIYTEREFHIQQVDLRNQIAFKVTKEEFSGNIKDSITNRLGFRSIEQFNFISVIKIQY